MSKEEININSEKEFSFNPQTHTYKLGGVKMTGVTTVLGIIAKPMLVPWAANMAVDYIKEHSVVEKSGRKNLYIVTTEVLEEARKSHQRKKEARGAEGHDTHKIIEEIIKQAIEFSDGYIQRPLFETAPQVSKFIDWAITEKAQFTVSEQVMYHPEWFVGGTADFVVRIKGHLYVGDIKTQKKIWDRVPFFQMAAYRKMLEHMGNKNFHGSIIVHLPVEGELEAHYSLDYESDLIGFTAALTLYRQLKNY